MRSGTMITAGESPIIRKRKKRRRRRAPLFPFVLIAIVVVGMLSGGLWVTRRHPMLATSRLPASYVSDTSALETEYAHFYGKPIAESVIRSRFRQAAELASQHNYPGASTVLETLSKDAAVPSVFSDLGILYSSLGDYPRAVDMFREALARDSEYAPARRFLQKTTAIPPHAAEPLNREAEGNNDAHTANLISLAAPVSGEVGAAHDPVDYFRIITPPAPRDLLTIEVENHSIKFSPRLRVYDSVLRLQGWGEKSGRAGDSIEVWGGPASNSSLYIAVAAEDSSAGQYVVTVKAQKAFDAYEPNDDIMSSRRITTGEEIHANIMDAEDTDFFSFASPRKGTVTIEIRNDSATLIPAVTTFNPDRRNQGFGPELRRPGLGLHHTIEVEKDQIYYLQVWSQAASAGAYTLRID
jgi:hypothetical protein